MEKASFLLYLAHKQHLQDSVELNIQPPNPPSIIDSPELAKFEKSSAKEATLAA